jgi:hypothetical protein
MGSDPYEGNWREYLDPDNDMWQDEESYYTEEEPLDRDE